MWSAGVCLSASTGKWLLKSHLVEPVITAGIQNRLQDGTSLRFLSALVAQAKLQSASFTRLLQMLLSDSRFRSGLLPASKVRENVVQLVEALHRQQPSLLNDLGGMHVLLAAYQGTLSPSDQALQRIFRLAELRGATSFRSLVSRWVPYELRGSCSTLLQVLASTNPDKLYNACRYVVQSGSTVDYDSAQVFDPVFVVPLLSIILDDEGLTRQSWITLAESNALGVAICTLGSSNRQYQAAGDRILAKARNGLQVRGARHAFLPALPTSINTDAILTISLPNLGRGTRYCISSTQLETSSNQMRARRVYFLLSLHFSLQRPCRTSAHPRRSNIRSSGSTC